MGLLNGAANSTQQERFATMLGELNMSGAEFARRTGLSDVSVSRWRNGSRSIQAGAAQQIESTFPQFSALWIQGRSPYRNDIEASAYDTAGRCGRRYLANHENVAVAINLAARSGYGVKLPNENVEQDSASRNPAVSIEHDGTTAEITFDAFEDFADELADFSSVRLYRIFNRATASDNSD